MKTLLVAALLVLQTAAADLRPFLGRTFDEIIKALDEFNKQKIQTGTGLAKVEAPNPAANVVVLNSDNTGAGLIASLSSGGLAPDQINLIFFGPTQHSMAVQILLSAKPQAPIEEILARLRQIYGLPGPIPFDGHHPAVRYPLKGIRYAEDGHWLAEADAPPVTVWALDNNIEAVFQPIVESSPLAGQLWMADKTSTNACAANQSK
jgi:hypothetical protein